MKLLSRPAICLIILVSQGALVAEIQTQHAIDSSVRIGRFEPLWHFRARTTPEGGGLFQIRTGPILEFDIRERLTLIAGYYLARQQEERQWTTTSRPFAGAEVSLWDRGIEVDGRSLVERFIVAGAPDYMRFRNRIRVSPPHDTAPYVAVEVFIDANGFRSARYSGGVRRTINSELSIDFGYFFEDRRPTPMGERHMFSTSLHWRNKTRRIDADF